MEWYMFEGLLAPLAIKAESSIHHTHKNIDRKGAPPQNQNQAHDRAVVYRKFVNIILIHASDFGQKPVMVWREAKKGRFLPVPAQKEKNHETNERDDFDIRDKFLKGRIAHNNVGLPK